MLILSVNRWPWPDFDLDLDLTLRQKKIRERRKRRGRKNEEIVTLFNEPFATSIPKMIKTETFSKTDKLYEKKNIWTTSKEGFCLFSSRKFWYCEFQIVNSKNANDFINSGPNRANFDGFRVSVILRISITPISIIF